MLELYKNIKKYRRELNITQQTLAEKAGYKDKSMIAKIEKGLVDLPQSKIVAFADIFGIEPGELMGYDDYLKGSDGTGNTELERFRDSLFFKESQNIGFISNGFHSMLNGIYSNIEEVDVGNVSYYKLSRGGNDSYVELDLFDTIESRVVKYIRNLIDDFKDNDVFEYIEANAAHDRTDRKVTEADIKHDEDIMNDDNF